MLSGSQLGLRAGVLNPVPQRVIALVPRCLHGRGRRTEPQHGYQKYKTDRFRQRAPLHEWSLLFHEWFQLHEWSQAWTALVSR